MANQVFCKKVNIVVEDCKATLSQKLKFYKEDNINIKFYITQINFETLEKPDGSLVLKDVVVPLAGVSAKMLIKVPNESLISVETTTVEDDNGIVFRFSFPYVNYLGTVKMQIVLTDIEGNIIHIPPIDVEISDPIGLLDDEDVAHTQQINTNRFTKTVLSADLTHDSSEDYYCVDIEHNIQDTDGNVFVSVVDKLTSEDLFFSKKILSPTKIRIILPESQDILVSIRR